MLEKMQRQIDSAMNDLGKKINMGTSGTNVSNYSHSDSKTKTITAKKFPARKTALLTSLPKKNLSRQELISFLSLLYSDLKKKLPPAKVAAAEAIISRLNKNATKVSAAAVVGWYKNAPAEAALLITYAASQAPDDITLNNCGAILNLCGLEQKAVPVLKYALVNEPNNSTLLNNIGQAYAAWVSLIRHGFI
jgi:predicted Zn-dependent protease